MGEGDCEALRRRLGLPAGRAACRLVGGPGVAWVYATEDDCLLLYERPREGPDFVSMRAETLLVVEHPSGTSLGAGDLLWPLPARARARVEGWISSTRLRAQAQWSWRDEERSRYVARGDARARAVLEAAAQPDEVLLGWWPTRRPLPVSRGELPPVSARAWLLVTDQRQALVATGALGELVVAPVEFVPEGRPPPEHPTDRLFPCDDDRPEARLRELATLTAADAPSRRLQVATLLLRHSRAARDHRRARAFVDELVEEGHALARLVAVMLFEDARHSTSVDDSSLKEALRTYAVSHTSAELLCWWRGTGRSLEAAACLLASCHSDDELRRWAVSFHAAVRAERLRVAPDDGTALRADCRYAADLLHAGRPEDASVVLDARRVALGDVEPEGDLPRSDDEDREGAAARLDLLALRVRASRAADRDELGPLRELAFFDPTDPSVIRDLQARTPAPERDALAQVLGVLDPGGLRPLDDALPLSPHGAVAPWSPEHVDVHLRHQGTGSASPVARVQEFLARPTGPAPDALRAYCEPLGARHVAAWSAFLDASTALSLEGVGGFVSRGERVVGVRAWHGAPPVLVIGGHHLDESDAARLHPWELRYAVASELCHLRYGETRFAPADVWSGAVDTGRLGAELLLGMVPLFKGIEVIDRLGRLIEHYRGSPVGRAIRGIDLAERTLLRARRRGTLSVSAAKPKSVAAAPLCVTSAQWRAQLTADRAGLLLAGDLTAALRGMGITAGESREGLVLGEERGLREWVAGYRAADDPTKRQLAWRITSLLRFSLTPSYRLLRAALESRAPSGSLEGGR